MATEEEFLEKCYKKYMVNTGLQILTPVSANIVSYKLFKDYYGDYYTIIYVLDNMYTLQVSVIKHGQTLCLKPRTF